MLVKTDLHKAIFPSANAKTLYGLFTAQPTNPVGRVYGRQPKTVAKRYIIAPKVSTFAL